MTNDQEQAFIDLNDAVTNIMSIHLDTVSEEMKKSSEELLTSGDCKIQLNISWPELKVDGYMVNILTENSVPFHLFSLLILASFNKINFFENILFLFSFNQVVLCKLGTCLPQAGVH